VTFGDISEIVPEMSFGFDGNDFEMQSPSKRSKISHQDMDMNDFDESIILPENNTILSNIIQFDLTDEADDVEKGQSKNTTRTLKLLQETIQESNSESVSFFKLSENVTFA
jgi:hypothetical protein